MAIDGNSLWINAKCALQRFWLDTSLAEQRDAASQSFFGLGSADIWRMGQRRRSAYLGSWFRQVLQPPRPVRTVIASGATHSRNAPQPLGHVSPTSVDCDVIPDFGTEPVRKNDLAA